MAKFAYITLLLNTGYIPGALNLAHSLRKTGSTVPIVLLYSSKNISLELVNTLAGSGYFDQLIPIDAPSILESRDTYNLNVLLQRYELSETLTKINLWSLTEFDKLVYLDSDTLIIKPIDHLFDIECSESTIVASPDCGWPDLFNSGVFMLKPNDGIYKKLLETYETQSSFDGADQGLLNEFFNLQSEQNRTNWHRLPFVYNCTMNSNYEYLPAFLRFQNDIHVLHFIGTQKPWKSRGLCDSLGFLKANLYNGKSQNVYELWWSLFEEVSIGDLDHITILRKTGNLQPRPYSEKFISEHHHHDDDDGNHDNDNNTHYFESAAPAEPSSAPQKSAFREKFITAV
ncbi:unnamed protein product [Ambrosiozyma monospora]|uniref:Unnamed protein product n=1 Tax=Ambrosiozyma monospora TaxID=43982 RepID=A0ACB5U6L1_AMBMO|nr:unnamed protein product [Ambrosiozyma monospora]